MDEDLRTARVSSKGRVAIPKGILHRLGLAHGTDLFVQVDGDTVVLRKVPRTAWRKWAGRFPGSGLIDELTASRREEIERNSKSS